MKTGVPDGPRRALPRVVRLLLLATLVVTACDTNLAARDYDQTCAVDADCVPIFEGEFCGACGITGSVTGINVKDQARYQRDREAIAKAGCPRRLGPLPPCAPPQPMPVVEYVGVCMASRCSAGVK